MKPPGLDREAHPREAMHFASGKLFAVLAPHSWSAGESYKRNRVRYATQILVGISITPANQPGQADSESGAHPVMRQIWDLS